MTDTMTQIVQGPGDLPKALDRPAQRLLGITALRRCDDPLEILDQSRISCFQRFATSPCTPHPTIRYRADRDLIQSTANGAAGNPGDPRHRGNPTPAGGQRLARCKNPPLPLVQIRAQHLEPLSDRRFVDHESTYGINHRGSKTTAAQTPDVENSDSVIVLRPLRADGSQRARPSCPTVEVPLSSMTRSRYGCI